MLLSTINQMKKFIIYIYIYIISMFEKEVNKFQKCCHANLELSIHDPTSQGSKIY